jgi:hypothetical protein
MTKHFLIVDSDTDEVVRVINTELTGGALERMEDGLYNRVDLARFHIDGPLDGKGPSTPS